MSYKSPFEEAAERFPKEEVDERPPIATPKAFLIAAVVSLVLWAVLWVVYREFG